MYNTVKKKSKNSRQSKKSKRNRYTKIDVYVVRINAKSIMTNARPCVYCTNTMKSIGVKKIFYSDWDGNIKMEHVRTMESTHVSIFQRQLINQYSHTHTHTIKAIRL